MMDAPVQSWSPDETLEIGRQLATMLRGGEIVLVEGPMGAGKSVLTRGMVAGLGGAQWRGSPTFTIVNEYATSPKLHHADLYRLERHEIGALGLEEYVRANSVLVVEWPERSRDYLVSLSDSGLIEVHLRLLGHDRRLVSSHGMPQPLLGHKPA